MRSVHSLVVLALLPCMVGAAEAGKGAKKNKNIVQGTVVSVQKADAKGEGSITLRLRTKKKQASAPSTPVEKTFKVTANTKFEVIAGKKGNVQKAAGDFSKVQKGGRVLVFVNGAEATDVKLLKHGKVKKKNT
jgi:hypothetical protein